MYITLYVIICTYVFLSFLLVSELQEGAWDVLCAFGAFWSSQVSSSVVAGCFPRVWPTGHILVERPGDGSFQGPLWVPGPRSVR